MEFRRVQPADVHANRAATIEVGADVVALLGIGNGVGLDLSLFANASAPRAIVSYCSYPIAPLNKPTSRKSQSSFSVLMKS